MAKDILDLGSWVILRMASSDTLPVSRALRAMGFDVWTPTAHKVGRMPRTRTEFDKEFALMPSYVFARVEQLGRLARIAMLPSPNHPRFSLFRYQGGFPLVAEAQLGALRGEEDRLGAVYDRHKRKGKKGPQIEIGTEIKLPDGPFMGLSGIVESQAGQFTLVSVDGFHEPIKVASILLESEIAEQSEAA